MKKLIGVAAVLVGLMLTAGNEALARDVLTAKEKAIIMSEVKRELKDPESARFKWPKLAKDIDMKSPDVAINYCGLVNAKNSYGGYVGDKIFRITLGWEKGKMHPVMTTIADDQEVAYMVCSELGYADSLSEN
jgi:hypothetical protein